MGETKPWKTWQNMASPKPTTAELVEIRVANAAEAARLESWARQRYQRAEPESVALYEAQDDIQKYVAEQKHWRRYANDYRKQLEAERAAEDRYQSREVGADDGDEEDDGQPMSAYEDLGGGVRT